MNNSSTTPQHAQYSQEPADKAAFTAKFDQTYTQIASAYNVFVKLCPPWKRWLRSVIPYIGGPRVLEVSFGTGYLLAEIATSNDNYEVHGVEYNKRLLEMTRQAMQSQNLTNVKLVHGTVEDLPYPNNYFDTVVVTMAFTGYPDGRRAMSELARVVKEEDSDGRLLIVDINYPNDEGNCLGRNLVKMWKAAGDIIRDMGSLFEECNLEYTDEEIGGFGSVHVYVATKTKA